MKFILVCERDFRPNIIKPAATSINQVRYVTPKYSGSAIPTASLEEGASHHSQPASMVHLEKSIGCWQFLQTWDLWNSSEKISFSSPQLGHLQMKDFKLLLDSNPGQC